MRCDSAECLQLIVCESFRCPGEQRLTGILCLKCCSTEEELFTIYLSIYHTLFWMLYSVLLCIKPQIFLWLMVILMMLYYIAIDDVIMMCCKFGLNIVVIFWSAIFDMLSCFCSDHVVEESELLNPTNAHLQTRRITPDLRKTPRNATEHSSICIATLWQHHQNIWL